MKLSILLAMAIVLLAALTAVHVFTTGSIAQAQSPSADLSVVKGDSADPIPGGNNLTYTINVANHGPATSTGVVLTDTLPSGATFISATSTQGTCTLGGTTVTCNPTFPISTLQGWPQSATELPNGAE